MISSNLYHVTNFITCMSSMDLLLASNPIVHLHRMPSQQRKREKQKLFPPK